MPPPMWISAATRRLTRSGPTPRVRAITGLHPWGMWGLARMLWFQKHRPDIYDRISRVMMISDWVAYRLSEYRPANHRGQFLAASGPVHARLVARVAELFHLRTDYYPPVYPSGTPSAPSPP